MTINFLRSSGFSWIEVLVSLNIILVLLLGLNATYVNTLKATKMTYYAAVAAQQLRSFSEVLYATNGANIAQIRKQWHMQLAKVLPHGREIIHINNGYLVASVLWGNDSIDCQKPITDQAGCINLNVFIEKDITDLV